MESRFWRTLGFAFIFGLAFDIAIGLLIARFADPNSWLSSGFFIFLAIQVATFVLYIKNLVAGWAWFFWKGRDIWADEIARIYYDKGFPAPQFATHSGEQYLSSLVDSDDAPLEMRLQAAAEIGAVGARKSLGITSTVQMGAALDAAIDRLREMHR